MMERGDWPEGNNNNNIVRHDTDADAVADGVRVSVADSVGVGVVGRMMEVLDGNQEQHNNNNNHKNELIVR